jgi:hypothetical protein
VHGDEHVHKTVHRVQQGVKKIQINTRIVDMNDLVPDSLANVLGDPLVIPSPGATQVPLGVITEEIVLKVKFQISDSI